MKFKLALSVILSVTFTAAVAEALNRPGFAGDPNS